MSDEPDEALDASLFEVYAISDATQCTQAFSDFLKDFRSHCDVFFFLLNLTTRADETRMVAAKALANAGLDAAYVEDYKRVQGNPTPALDQLKKLSTVVSQNLTNGVVNSFQRYFSSIIQSAAHRMPMMMASSQTVRVDDVLKFTRHRDLVAFIIDRKINELSYGGLTDMEKYFGDRLGVSMFRDDRQRGLLRLFVESRNINVHNGGVVNDLFVARVGKVDGFPYKLGSVFHVDFDALSALSTNAMEVAAAIDAAVAAKFKLRRRAHRSW